VVPWHGGKETSMGRAGLVENFSAYTVIHIMASPEAKDSSQQQVAEIYPRH